ncbi:glycosyltransferase family 1 protein, partial [Nonomuraea sp. NPDC055795]
MPSELEGLRVAVVNWRDPWHPAAGGAETYAWQIAHCRRTSAHPPIGLLVHRDQDHAARLLHEGLQRP